VSIKATEDVEDSEGDDNLPPAISKATSRGEVKPAELS